VNALVERGRTPTEFVADGPRANNSDEFVQSLARGLSVIKAFDSNKSALTLSEVAAIAQLPRAAARRFLRTLVELDYMHFDGKQFRLLPRVLELGYAYLSSVGLPQVAQRHMEMVSNQVHESCSMAVLDGTDIVCIARVHARRIMSMWFNVGTRFPAYVTSMGRVLLGQQPEEWLADYLATASMPALTPRSVTDPKRLRAEIERARTNGYCIVDQELEIGIRTMAVPIHDPSGKVVAAIDLSAHASRGKIEVAKRELLAPLQLAAKAVEADLRVASR
jgi:IclR family pca regulon transcriptional regulator